MIKKYKITQEQFNKLVETKKREKKIFESIMNEIDRVKNGLNESTIKKSAIADILKKHQKKGNLTQYIISKLEENKILLKKKLNENVTSSSQSIDIEQQLDKMLKSTLDQAVKEIPILGNKIGDKDGEIEDLETNESSNINEAGVLLAVGTLLAAPKLIEMIGKGVRQLGKKVDNGLLKTIGEKLSKSAHKLHHQYQKPILWAIKKKYPNMHPEKATAIANGIILSATVALGVSSITGLMSAAKAGELTMSGVEAGLTGLKALEITEIAVEILPSVMNGFFK